MLRNYTPIRVPVKSGNNKDSTRAIDNGWDTSQCKYHPPTQKKKIIAKSYKSESQILFHYITDDFNKGFNKIIDCYTR